MSDEIKEAQQVKAPRSKKQETPIQPIFRRKEDEIRFEVIERLLSILKYSIILIIAILYFFYQIITSQNKTDTYQIKLLNETLERLNRQEQILENRFSYGISKKALPGTCIVCHAPGRFDIIIPKDWKFDNFREYVRGEVRIPENKNMPTFDKNVITDQQLEEIFKILSITK